MNLVSFSIKTKGVHNFARRLTTVFSRFGFTEQPTRRALYTIIKALEPYEAAPTFFIPAVVLDRHPRLLAEIASERAEIGIHGYVHNDYRTISYSEQHEQTARAISVFQEKSIPYQGFRNPYLGWTQESLQVFTDLGFTYDSNDAVVHHVIDLDQLSPLLRSGYEKSLELFQAIECSSYTLRPYYVGPLLRIPTSIPDDEMLFDRLRLDNTEIGRIWSSIMERVYTLGGIYVLNLHPERAVLCKQALETLLSSAQSQEFPTWVASLKEVARWWKKRRDFQMVITPLENERWQVEAACDPRATILARHLVVENQATSPWYGEDTRVMGQRFTVQATRRPCIGLSQQTHQDVKTFLTEQGYPFMLCDAEEAHSYAYYIDQPRGLGKTREEQIELKSRLLQELEAIEAPLLTYGCWPDGSRAALSITGDIDSVTVQDFFRRIVEVQQYR